MHFYFSCRIIGATVGKILDKRNSSFLSLSVINCENIWRPSLVKVQFTLRSNFVTAQYIVRAATIFSGSTLTRTRNITVVKWNSVMWIVWKLHDIHIFNDRVDSLNGKSAIFKYNTLQISHVICWTIILLTRYYQYFNWHIVQVCVPLTLYGLEIYFIKHFKC